MNEINMDEINKYSDYALDFVMDYGPKLIGGILTLIIGLWIIKRIVAGVKTLFDKREIDDSLKPFLIGIIGALLRVFLGVSVLGMIGIEMTSFIAILGAAGLAVGMALSGTLQNFAGGVIILILKPYKVGDYIDAQGYNGTVDSIQIFNTYLKTVDNKTIIIPNGPLSTGSMINFSTEPKRRVDWTYGIAYGDSIQKAREILMEILNADDRIHKDPAPFVQVSGLADSSVNLATRVWVDSADYWAVYMETMEKVYDAFNEKGIGIPFPQMDVHIHKNEN